MEIGEKIKKIRELKNFTQEYMANKLEVSQATYSRMEKEDGYLTVIQLQKISEILGVKIEDLINFSDRYVFNNYDVKNANQGYNVINYSENEKRLYEDKIKLLEDKISYLQDIINDLKRN